MDDGEEGISMISIGDMSATGATCAAGRSDMIVLSDSTGLREVGVETVKSSSERRRDSELFDLWLLDWGCVSERRDARLKNWTTNEDARDKTTGNAQLIEIMQGYIEQNTAQDKVLGVAAETY